MDEEFENIGPVEDGIQDVAIDVIGDNYAAVELLINFVNSVQVEFAAANVLRLSGGYKRTRSFRMAPMRPPPQARLGTLNDLMEIGSLLRNEMADWRESYHETFPGHGRSTAGVVDSTVSTYPDWYQPMAKSDEENFRDEAYGTAALATGVNLLRRFNPLRLTLPGWPGRSSGQSSIPPDFYTRTSQDSNSKEIEMDGYSMLEWKNRLTRKLKSHYLYRMSNVRVSQQQVVPDGVFTTLPAALKAGTVANYSTFLGTGPALIGNYTITPFTIGNFGSTGDNPRTGRPNYDLAELKIEDIGFFQDQFDWANSDVNRRLHTRGIGVDNVVYIMAADWIGGMMCPFSHTQYETYDFQEGVAAVNQTTITDINKAVFNQRAGNYLCMERVPYGNTTDLNLPININTLFSGAQKWTYITHYYTVWNFAFTNYAETPYIIEFMVFQFKAEINTFDYERAALAVVNRQRYKFQDYVDGVSDAPQDITVIYRKRMMIGAINHSRSGSTVQLVNKNSSNRIVWKYVQKRKYVIKRPIVNDWDLFFTEKQSFNTYYDAQNGQYIRLQAWPVSPGCDLALSGGHYLPSLFDGTSNFANPNVDDPKIKTSNTAPDNVTTMWRNGTNLYQGVDVVIDKKSHFKLDEPLN